jgi:MFS superfamily sulfate permease-like transporter
MMDHSEEIMSAHSLQANSRRLVNISRPVYKQKEFDQEFAIHGSTTKKGTAYFLRDNFFKSNKCFLMSIERLIGLFSIFKLFAEYDFKSNLVADIISGFTIGVMHIPSGKLKIFHPFIDILNEIKLFDFLTQKKALAYGALTSLHPVNGLYTSFFPGLAYVVFGTSRHLSVGTFALISLMVYSTVSRLELEYSESLKYSHLLSNSLRTVQPTTETATRMDIQSLTSVNYELNNNTSLNFKTDIDMLPLKVKIATSLAFWCGIFQVS